MLPPAEVAVQTARRQFEQTGNLLVAWAPGRINLIGEHTDYNEGWVLPIAITRVVALAGALHPADDRTVQLFSVHHGEAATFDLDHPPSAAQPDNYPLWARYIAGVVGELQAMGISIPGFSVAIAGDVPLGGGLSSSAALTISTLTWLQAALGRTFPTMDLAQIGQRAETRGSGVRVGILDHAASVLGKSGAATLLDCRSLTFRYIPFQLADVGMLLCETGVERSLASSNSYNQRRAECQQAVESFALALGEEGRTAPVQALRDISMQDYLRLAGHVAEPARHRARHVIAEDARTLAAAEALSRDDAITFGELVLASHASLRDDFAVSCHELDTVVELATRHPGALGARLVGAGFGGGVLIVARQDALDAISADIARDYPMRTGLQPTIYRLTAAGGPGSIVIPA